MMDNYNPFMAEAIRLATENVETGRGGPFAAVVVKDGKIIASGVNQVTYTNDPTAHAEVMAIRNACKALGTFQLDDCEIYTSCEPCPMCLGAIYWARPGAVFYGNTKADGSYIKEIARIERQDLLIIDDFGLQPLDNQNRSALMEIIEDRHGKSSVIITSQVPVHLWYDIIGEKTIADAILDRIVHDAHRVELCGESLRNKKNRMNNLN
jgi:tRNA(Arg) A34 adenosine deaminase TadA